MGLFPIDPNETEISAFSASFSLKLQDNWCWYNFLKNVLNEEATDMFYEGI